MVFNKTVLLKVAEQEMFGDFSEGLGFCLSCGEEAYGVEPDAEKYKCDFCGKHEVYGIESLILML